MVRSLAISTIFLFLAAGPVSAESPALAYHEPEFEPELDPKPNKRDYARPGAYLGLSGVFALENFRDDAIDVLGSGTDFDESGGFSGRLGWRANRHLAAEIQHEWIEGFDLQQFAGDHSEIRTWSTTANLKVYLATGLFQPYLVAGTGVTRGWVRNSPPGGVDFNEVEFVGRAGAGIDFYVTEALALNFEATYVAPTGDLNDFDRVALGWGVQYRF